MKTQRFLLILGLLTLGFLITAGLSGGNFTPDSRVDPFRAFTRPIEFEYSNWILNALWTKFSQSALNAYTYLDSSGQRRVVARMLDLTEQRSRLRGQIEQIYADPSVQDPKAASQTLQEQNDALAARLALYEPLAESILQQQVATALTEAGLTTGGQPLPPVLFRTTALPLALIISPRGEIRQRANISLLPDLSVETIDRLEKTIEKKLNVSALVVEVGGIGVYPTMVMSTTDLPWLVDTIAHEWTHNYLTLRPLGFNYDTSPELRTMNETTASIAGNELRRILLKRFYPELLPPEPAPAAAEAPSESPAAPQPPPFDFRKEMHTTRVQVDRLLAEGRIAEAEFYMEARRQVFWINGYQIRRLNQAYFAFYGAYADSPGGAAGEDPVGPAVRELRSRSASLAVFIQTIARMNSFEALQQALK